VPVSTPDRPEDPIFLLPINTPEPTNTPTLDPTMSPVTLLTSSPTIDPALSPTALLTDTPGGVKASIQVDKSAYAVGEDIRITFEHDQPESKDWIGLRSASEADNQFTVILWVWTCGTQTCEGGTSGGTIVFGSGDPYEGAEIDFEMIETGSYYVHLLRGTKDENGVYDSFAISPVFTIG
jgi:hypothetical protein